MAQMARIFVRKGLRNVRKIKGAREFSMLRSSAMDTKYPSSL